MTDNNDCENLIDGDDGLEIGALCTLYPMPRSVPHLVTSSEVDGPEMCGCKHTYHRGGPCRNQAEQGTDACLPCIFGCPPNV